MSAIRDVDNIASFATSVFAPQYTATFRSTRPERPVESREKDIGRLDRRTVEERDDLIMGVQAGVDLPLVGGADLRERRTPSGGAKADEHQRISQRRAVAVEIDDDVAARLSRLEHERVVAGIAL